jgi:hypothetical protein
VICRKPPAAGLTDHDPLSSRGIHRDVLACPSGSRFPQAACAPGMSTRRARRASPAARDRNCTASLVVWTCLASVRHRLHSSGVVERPPLPVLECRQHACPAAHWLRISATKCWPPIALFTWATPYLHQACPMLEPCYRGSSLYSPQALLGRPSSAPRRASQAAPG